MKSDRSRIEEQQFITKEFADTIVGKTPGALQGGISLSIRNQRATLSSNRFKQPTSRRKSAPKELESKNQ